MKNLFNDNSGFTDFSDFVVVNLAQNSSPVIGGGTPPAPILGPPIDITDETREAEASFAASGDGGPGSVTVVGGPASAGLTINLIFDAAAMAAPQSFRDGITAAMQQICAVVTDKITINIQIDYSGTGGGASAGPTGGNYVGYSTVRADLVNNASPGDTTFNSLPTGSTIAGQSQVAVWYAQEKLWGLLSPTGTEVDGSATFSTDINSNLLVGVALHELTHAMGRVPYGSQPDVFDFYRFTSPGNYLFNGNSTAPAAYFSLNNGATKLADYGQTSDPSDFLNGGVQGSTDPFNEFYSGSTQQQLTAMDLKQLDALGFHLLSNQPSTTVIEAKGSTELVQVGSNFYLNPVAAGTGPELKYQGAPVTTGEFGTYVPLGVEAVSGGGYEVAWFDPAHKVYSIWSTDSSGNYTGNFYQPGSGTTTAFESFEPSFQQDLNGDGTIGIPAPTGTVIESIGTTAVVQVGNNYFLNPVAGGTGPELNYQGAPVTVGEFGAYVPLGVEPVSGGGYEVAWFDPAHSLYSVWSTDSSGNYTGNFYQPGSGNSPVLEALEQSFHQDLNGDGTIGIPANSTVIESVGTSELVKVGSNYFLDPVVGGISVELKYQGAPVTVGEFGAYVPLGVEPVSGGGYEVAWFDPAHSLYSVWSVDANGNYTGNYYQPGAGNSVVLESLEPSFHQDLNADGQTGLPANTSLSEGVGSTALVEVSNNFYLDPVAGGTGPELKYQGTPFTLGQFGDFAWVPTGVEPVSGGGYEVSWFDPAHNLYSVWSTDSNGNYTGNFYQPGSGTTTAFETLETSFHQDLNRDGTIGIPAHTSPVPDVASAAPAAPTTLAGGDSFVFRSDLGSGAGSGGSAPVTSQQPGQLLELAFEHVAAELQHFVMDGLADLTGGHDNSSHGPLFDLLHGFIIH